MLRSNSKQYFVRYDFNRLAVYLSFRTSIGGSSPSPPLAASLYTRTIDLLK